MTVTYDEEVDVLTLTLSRSPIVRSDEVQPGVILDFDQAGNTVSIELLDASRRADDPFSLSIQLTRVQVPAQVPEQPALAA